MQVSKTETRFGMELKPGMSAIDAAEWDAMAGQVNPFVSHAFLLACEESGSAVTDTGWQPHHVLLRDEAGALAGVCPLYAKYHSYGEYIFDHGWADALERAGGNYYPKLLSAVPFTPATGPRLMAQSPEAQGALLQGLAQVAENAGISSVHVNFVPQSEAALAEGTNYLVRHGMQYHWQNDGYDSFDDFLAALNSKKRKAIKKERREVSETDLKMLRLTGDDIKPHHWDAFWDFYMDTSERKWGQAYLTRAFFDQLHETMRDKVLLVMAEEDGELVAGALNLIGQDTLFGRNWGCLERAKFLHFEACYYQALDFAIERGLSKVEAGAQGHHKLQRGYLPSLMYSLHWMKEPQFHKAIARYLGQERQGIAAELEALSESSPFANPAN